MSRVADGLLTVAGVVLLAALGVAAVRAAPASWWQPTPGYWSEKCAACHDASDARYTSARPAARECRLCTPECCGPHLDRCCCIHIDSCTCQPTRPGG